MRRSSSYWRNEQWVWVAFVLVVMFLVAQVGWWFVFQRHLIQQSIDYASTNWLQEAEVVQQLWTAAEPADRADLAKELREQFPQLQIQGNKVFVNSQQLASFRNQQLHHLRMLAFEVPFFLLIMLLGLWMIARSLRREQDFKRRHKNFLMAATHEFRTPIGAIKLMLQTLQMRQVSPEKQAKYLANMSHELSRLETLSERLLATARLERGLSAPNNERQDLAQVVDAKIHVLRPTLEARGAQLFLQAPAHPLPVELDTEALGLVVSNLLENALKYSPDSQKPIWIRLGSNHNQAILEIEDRGLGISRAALPHIFEPFYRAGDEQTRETSGLGLGLYLVKALIELMSGQVVCEPLEHGTRFSLFFPLVAGSLGPIPERSPA